MKNQVLTVRQMLELKNLGIDITKSSLLWRYPKDHQEKAELILTDNLERVENLLIISCESFKYVHTFTVMDLINLLPEEIVGNYILGLNIYDGTVSYLKYDYDSTVIKYQTYSDKIIDALYEMVLLLINKKLFKF